MAPPPTLPSPSTPHKVVLLFGLLSFLVSTTAASAFSESWLPLRRAAIPPVGGADKVAALPSGSLMAGTNWVCKELGECQPCPIDQLNTPVCSFYGHRRPLSCTPLHPTTNSYSSQTKTIRPSSQDHTSYNSNDDDPQANNDDDDDKLLAAAAAALAAAKPIPTTKTGHSASNARPQPDATQEDEFDANPVAAPAGSGDSDEAGWDAPAGAEAGEQLDAGVDEAIADAEEEWAEEGVELVEERARERWRRQGRLDEVRTWEACGKVVAIERKDFGEFVLCNLFFAVASVATLSYRYRHLASRQYGTLVARLGMSVS